MCEASELVLREILGDRFDRLNPTTKQILLKTPHGVIQGSHALLKGFGADSRKIATNAQLLAMNPGTLLKKYQFLRRFFPREVICDKLQMLGNSKQTLESSVQFLSGLDTDHEKNANSCFTTAGNKRRKIVALAKARYGLSNDLSKAERMELLQRAREFVRSNMLVLRMSERRIQERFARVH